MNISRRPARRTFDEHPPESAAVSRPVRPVTDDDDDASDDAPLVQLRGGWTAGKQQAESTSEYAQAFKPDGKSQIVKFLEDAPYVNFRRHWVERNGVNGVVKRPYVCPQSVGKSCPLCNLGDKPQAVSSFNVALIGDDGVPTLKTWDLGVKLFNVLAVYNEDPKVGPLTRGYFAVSVSSGGAGSRKGGTTQTNINPVKPSQLDEWGTVPPNPKELDALGLYDASIIKLPKKGELEEIAEEMASEY